MKYAFLAVVAFLTLSAWAKLAIENHNQQLKRRERDRTGLWIPKRKQQMNCGNCIRGKEIDADSVLCLARSMLHAQRKNKNECCANWKGARDAASRA